MSRGFWTRLVFPLVGAFALVLVIHIFWKADGLFLNLGTEIFGILITVCYVDWIVREHKRREWQSTDTRIANRLRILLNVIVSSIRHGLGYGPEILNERVMASADLIAAHKEVIRMGEHVISPGIHHRIRSLDANGWKSLARQIEHAHNGTLVFLSAFQGRLGPEQISHLLDIEEGLSHSLTFYTTFPELVGVPHDQLPDMKSPSGELQQHGCESAANEISKVLAIAKRLSETLDKDNA